MAADARVPVVLVTGFLGAGKTTLVNHVLRNAGGLKVAVLVNEVGSIDIDSQLLENKAAFTGGLLELKNGCVCCTIQTELQDAITRVVTARPGALDYVLVEASGVTDPAPVVFTITKGSLSKLCRFEAVVALVSADDLAASWLRKRPVDGAKEAEDGDERCDVTTLTSFKAQLSNADMIVLNKVDLVTDAEVAALCEQLAERYPRTFVERCHHGGVPVATLLHTADSKGARRRHGTAGSGKVAEEGAAQEVVAAGKVVQHEPHGHAHGHKHEEHEGHGSTETSHLTRDRLVSVGSTCTCVLPAWRFGRFVLSLPAAAVRAKAIVQLECGGTSSWVVMQKAGRRVHVTPAQRGASAEDGTPQTQLVVIGVGIDTARLERQWESMCAAVVTPSGSSGDSEHTALCARRAAALAELVEDDHRFFGTVEGTTAVSFGLCGNVGLAFVERERRSELNRELLECINLSGPVVLAVPGMRPAPEGGQHLAVIVDCRGDASWTAKELWRTVEEAAIPLLTQLFAEAMCC